MIPHHGCPQLSMFNGFYGHFMQELGGQLAWNLHNDCNKWLSETTVTPLYDRKTNA